jgi:sulfite exporter TauE/SafE
MELKEVSNYTTFLEKSRKTGIKHGILTGLSNGFMFCTVYLSYAYAAYIGGIWIEK